MGKVCSVLPCQKNYDIVLVKKERRNSCILLSLHRTDQNQRLMTFNLKKKNKSVFQSKQGELNEFFVLSFTCTMQPQSLTAYENLDLSV